MDEDEAPDAPADAGSTEVLFRSSREISTLRLVKRDESSDLVPFVVSG